MNEGCGPGGWRGCRWGSGCEIYIGESIRLHDSLPTSCVSCSSIGGPATSGFIHQAGWQNLRKLFHRPCGMLALPSFTLTHTLVFAFLLHLYYSVILPARLFPFLWYSSESILHNLRISSLPPSLRLHRPGILPARAVFLPLLSLLPPDITSPRPPHLPSADTLGTVYLRPGVTSFRLGFRISPGVLAGYVPALTHRALPYCTTLLLWTVTLTAQDILGCHSTVIVHRLKRSDTHEFSFTRP